MSKALAKHLAAIQNGAVEKTNVIGLRKALNDAWRRRRGYSVAKNSTADDIDVCQIENALYDFHPRVTGELHDSGVTVLQNKRYRKKVEPYADIVADIERFELVAFDEIGRGNHVPLYRIVGKNGRGIYFRNVPWQSGGNGPEFFSRIDT